MFDTSFIGSGGNIWDGGDSGDGRGGDGDDHNNFDGNNNSRIGGFPLPIWSNEHSDNNQLNRYELQRIQRSR